MQYRTFDCMAGGLPAPFYQCEGMVQREERACNTELCESWAFWSPWTPCSSSCGRGSRTRTRTCDNGEAGDAGCQGESFEFDMCIHRVSILCENI